MSTEVWALERDLCRCCHSEGSFKHLSQQCTILGEEKVYSDMLQECLNITLTPTEGHLHDITYTICDLCAMRLQDVANFRLQVLACEEMFKDMWSRNIITIKDVKSSIKSAVKEEIVDFNDDCKEEYLDIEDDIEPAPELHFEVVDEKNINVNEKKPSKRKARGSKIKPQGKSKISLKRTATNKQKSPETSKQDVKPTIKNAVKEEMLDFNEDCKEDLSHTEDTDKSLPDLHFEGLIDDEEIDVSATKPAKRKPRGAKLKLQTNTKVAMKKIAPAASESSKGLRSNPRLGYLNRFTITLTENNEKIYNCEDCDACFTKRNLYHQHYTGVHLKRRRTRHLCQMCPEMLTPHFRARHLEEVHGIPAPMCNACGKKFAFPNQVLRHQRVYHMLERKHMCKHCGKRFTTSTKLNIHLSTHSSIRLFVCHICEKAFKRQSSLSTHIDMHMDRKKFQCGQCEAAFVQLTSLKYHLKTRHPDDM